jgi:hypothetical protein
MRYCVLLICIDVEESEKMKMFYQTNASLFYRRKKNMLRLRNENVGKSCNNFTLHAAATTAVGH